MGISANQARMLTLTGRKCDLEKQMQVILNGKLRIAEDMSKIAQDYNDAVSNKALFVFQPSTDASQQTYLELSAANLRTKARGNYLVAVNDGGTYRELYSADTDNLSIEEGLRTGEYVLVQEADMQTQDPKSISFTTNYADGNVLDGTPQQLMSDGVTYEDVTDWEIVDWRSATDVMDKLDDSDDLTAQTSYEAKMTELNVKETKMNIEMKEIETEHSAISNEMESVKKMLTKNTEDSYKYFG